MKNKTFDYSNLNNSFRLKRANSVSSLNSFSIQYNGITEKGRKKETIYFISYPGNPVFGQLWCRKTSNPIFSARYYFPVFRFPSEATHFLFHFPSKAKPEGKGNKATRGLASLATLATLGNKMGCFAREGKTNQGKNEAKPRSCEKSVSPSFATDFSYKRGSLTLAQVAKQTLFSTRKGNKQGREFSRHFCPLFSLNCNYGCAVHFSNNFSKANLLRNAKRKRLTQGSEQVTQKKSQQIEGFLRNIRSLSHQSTRTDLETSLVQQKNLSTLLNEETKSLSPEDFYLRKAKNFYSSYSKFYEINQLTIQLASPERIRLWAEKILPNQKIIGRVTNANTLHYKTFKPQKNGLFCERIFGPLKDFECACGKNKKKMEQKLTNLKTWPVLREPKIDLKNFSNEINPSLSLPTPLSSFLSLAKLTPEGREEKEHGKKEKQETDKGLLQMSPKPVEDESSEQIVKNGNEGDDRKFCPECDVEYTWSVIRRYQLGYIQLAAPVTHFWYLKGTPSYLSLLLNIKKRDLEAIIYCSESLTLEAAWNYRPFLSESPSNLFQSWQKTLPSPPSLAVGLDNRNNKKSSSKRKRLSPLVRTNSKPKVKNPGQTFPADIKTFFPSIVLIKNLKKQNQFLLTLKTISLFKKEQKSTLSKLLPISLQNKQSNPLCTLPSSSQSVNLTWNAFLTFFHHFYYPFTAFHQYIALNQKMKVTQRMKGRIAKILLGFFKRKRFTIWSKQQKMEKSQISSTVSQNSIDILQLNSFKKAIFYLHPKTYNYSPIFIEKLNILIKRQKIKKAQLTSTEKVEKGKDLKITNSSLCFPHFYHDCGTKGKQSLRTMKKLINSFFIVPQRLQNWRMYTIELTNSSESKPVSFPLSFLLRSNRTKGKQSNQRGCFACYASVAREQNGKGREEKGTKFLVKKSFPFRILQKVKFLQKKKVF